MARILIVLSDSTWLGRFLKTFEQMSIPDFCTRPTPNCLYPPPRPPSKAPEQSCCRPNPRDTARSCEAAARLGLIQQSALPTTHRRSGNRYRKRPDRKSVV